MDPRLREMFQHYNYLPERQVMVAGRKIDVPVVYPDASAIMVFFPAQLDRVKKIINTERIQPIKLWTGKTILAVTLFDYRECAIGPYREFTMSIPVVIGSRFVPPILPLVFNSLFKDFGFYVFQLGASSDLARKHIIEIFPYPLFQPDIDVIIEEKEQSIHASLWETYGEKILTVSGQDVLPQTYALKEKMYKTYYKANNGIFRVRLDIFSFFTQSFKRKNLSVTWGHQWLSKYLQEVISDESPLGIMYYKKAVEVAGEPQRI